MKNPNPVLFKPHAIVIGSGFGGLAAAVRLGAKGYRVTVLEKLDAPGGRAYVHRRNGHVFDAGPTIITGPFLLEELWALCGKKLADHVELRHLKDLYYRIRFDDGTWFDYNGDVDAMRQEVARFSPEDLPGYENFFKEAEKCYRLGYEGMASKAFDSIGDFMEVIPDFLRMGAWKSIYSLVAKHIKNPKLRQVFSFHPLLIGGNPFSVTCAYSLINILERRHGVHWAMGGTGSLINGLVDLIRGQGNQVLMKSEVKQIVVEQGRATGVLLASGEKMDADIVVSNGDTAWTYKNLVPAEFRKTWTDRKIERTRSSMGVFVWYFGINKRFDDVPQHMILMGLRYKELLSDIFKRHVLADDFSLYLHRPSAHDPSMAPEGCDTYYVLSPVPNLQNGVDWAQQAEPYRKSIEKYLSDTVLPGFESHITESLMTTPLDFQNRLLSYRGAAFGPEPILTQSAWFRPHNRSEDVKNLFMVGASTHPGAGVPGVIGSAKALESVLPDAKSFAPRPVPVAKAKP